MATINIAGGRLEITLGGKAGPNLCLSIEEWRILNKAVEAVVDETFVSYDDAEARLGIHRSTLNDWIARGTLERILIGGRKFVTATSLSAVILERPESDQPRAASAAANAEPASKATSPHPASGHRSEPTEPSRRSTRSQRSAELPNPTTAKLSPESRALVRALTDGRTAIEPGRFLTEPAEAERPGMYSWWGDDEALVVLGDAIGVQLPHLLYVGQAGATKWPSGTKSSATLASRIGRQHIRGNARSSTFRLTISSLLAEPLSLVAVSGGKLDPASNARASAWIAEHLRVAIAPFDDRDALGRLENEVIAHLNPPLNLDYCPSSEARSRITLLRHALRLRDASG